MLLLGVPQGSVLGPKKYCMFSKPIGQICKRHNMSVAEKNILILVEEKKNNLIQSFCHIT
jgi:hypothetical protein